MDKTTQYLNDFIHRATKHHGGKYDYSKVVYIHSLAPVEIVCPHHGSFYQKPALHARRIGCPECGANATRLTRDEYITRANNVHGGKYDYTDVVYTSTRHKINVKCVTHGSFLVRASKHLEGIGCPKCTDTTLTTEEFIHRAKQVHGDVYDYSQTVYINARTDVDIICKKHGLFKQPPMRHVTRKCGCPECKPKSSITENEWLDELNVPKESRQVLINVDGTKYRVDGYDAQTNTVYEFWGDYWHGNPNVYNPQDVHPTTKQTYGEMYERTMLKKEQLIAAGYNVVDVWEKDYNGS